MANKKAEIQAYNEFVRGVEILSVRLGKIKAEFPGADAVCKEPPEVMVNRRAKYEEKEKRSADVTVSYKLKADEQKTGTPFLKIDCDFVVSYRFARPLTPEIWKVFKELNVPLITWPFFRELVQSITVRFGLSPLTLPALHR